MSILIADRTINSVYASFPSSTLTLFVILLVKQREDLDISLTEMLVVVLQTAHAVTYRSKGDERLSARSLKIVLPDHDGIIPFSIAGNGKRLEELSDVFFGSLE